MQDVFDRHQLVYLTNTGAKKMAELAPYIDLMMDQSTSEYVGGGNDRHKLEPYFYETGAPLSADLHYHHEMTYIGESIKKISFSCIDTIDDP